VKLGEKLGQKVNESFNMLIWGFRVFVQVGKEQIVCAFSSVAIRNMKLFGGWFWHSFGAFSWTRSWKKNSTTNQTKNQTESLTNYQTVN
jgi:hypothetical protein